MTAIPTLRSMSKLAQRPEAALEATKLGLTALVAWQIAGLFWALVSPLGPLGPSTAPLRQAAAPPAIDLAALSRFDPFHRAPAASGAPIGDLSQLGLTLFAVREGGPDGGGAIIQAPDRGQRSFSIGDAISPGVILQSVSTDFVTLERDGATYQLGFPNAPVSGPAGAPIAAPAPRVGDATLKIASTVDPAALIGELALQARIENGEVTGYTLREGRAGPIMQRLGLKPGDVLLEVNNHRLLDDERVAELQTELMSRPEAVIRYERAGEVKTATVRINQP